MTEVPGADDLHDADGILADAMARTAALYGARRCWYSSAGPPLACWRASAPWHRSEARRHCARNCHKAVYHAIELGR